MSDGLPTGWEMTRLGDLLRQRTEKVRLRPDGEYERLGVRWYAEGVFRKEKVTGSEIKGTTLYQPQAEDFIYNRLFAWKGSFAVVPDEMAGCYVSNEFPIFEVRRDKADPWFLWRWFSQPTVWRMIEHRSTGSTPTSRLRYKEEDLLALTVPLPPLSEQKALVTVLQIAYEAYDARRRELAAERERKAALMEKLFTWGIGGATRQEIEIESLPQGWKMSSLGNVAQVSSGGTPDRTNPDYWNGSIPWVKTGEITYNTIFDTEEKITHQGLQNSSARILPTGTLLMAMYGQGVTRGRVALLGIDAAINQACAALRFDLTQVEPRFAFYYLARAYVALRNLGHGTNQTNMNSSHIKSFPIPLPPLDEQRQIAIVFTACDGKITALEKEAALHEELFHALLEELISGRVSTRPLIESGVALEGDAP